MPSLSEKRNIKSSLANKDRESSTGSHVQRFCQTLKQLREQAGLTPEHISHATKIRLPSIEALEKGAFDKLPGQIFGRGFVASIAKTLGVDSEPLVQLYDEAYNEFTDNQTKTTSSTSSASFVTQKPAHQSADHAHQKGRQWWSMFLSFRWITGMTPLGLLSLAAGIGLVASLVFAGLWVTKQFSESPASQNTATREPIAVHMQASNPIKQPIPPSESLPPTTDKDAATTNNDIETASTHEEALANHQSTNTSPVTDTKEASQKPHADDNAQESLTKQKLEIAAKEPVRIRLKLDQQPWQTRQLDVGQYTLEFNQRANLLIFDASAVSISFNGKPLGYLGKKGRVRRLSFEKNLALKQNSTL